jgi:hypothetical protein
MRPSLSLCLVLATLVTARAAPAPAILFASPQGAAYGYVDLGYLGELHAKGFEVDYTEALAELTWERLARYHALVLYEYPAREAGKVTADLVDRYLQAGGGVLLFPTEMNAYRHPLYETTSRYGLRVPTERLVEKDAARTARFPHMPGTTAAYTDQVAPSPVSEGVKGVWYPTNESYNCSHTTPIVVDPTWQVVLRGSPTSTSVPVDLKTSLMPELENAFSRPGPETAPAFFAIRDLNPGRLAFLNQWRVHTVGSGTKWLFERRILSQGFDTRPSDMGRLLENTFRWLCAPSLASGTLGGYTMPPDRLTPPNLRPETKQAYNTQFWHYEPEVLGYGRPPATAPLFRGLIGARTAYSTGQGSVADYARAAEASGLDFVVFAEDFAAMTPAKLEQLRADCAAASTATVQLYAGFTVTDNIGNRMLLCGTAPAWVPDYCLTGPGKTVFYRQATEANGLFTGYGTPALDWALATYHDTGNIGYFHFTADPHGNRVQHLRLYAMAALRTYEGGRLVEDVTADYLVCAAGTIPPTPVSVNLVRSPEELSAEARLARGLTYCQAKGRGSIFQDALRWTHQYDAVNTFPSDGPRILAWPACHRVGTLGAEEFVTAPAVMPSPLAVSAEKGLREVRIHNGPELFRRFLLDGQKEWSLTLVLEATVQKNLVAVVTDMAGGTAVSFARRCWKDGGREVVFCSDHVNDCKSGGLLLAHGAVGMLINWPPPLHPAIAGDTWDGGPPAALPLATWQDNQPRLRTSAGDEDGARFNQTPLLEFTDSGAVAVSSAKTDLFDPQMQTVVNPWHTFGPVGYAPRLMTFVQSYREWLNPTVGVPPVGWAGPGVRAGGDASLYRCEITFLDAVTVNGLDLFAHSGVPAQSSVRLALKIGEAAPREIELAGLANPETMTLERGDWFALYSADTNSAQILCNRAEPLSLTLANAKAGGWIAVRAANLPRPVNPGERYRCEVASLAFPVDVPVHTLADVERCVRYVQAPDGFDLRRGQRLADSPGLVDLAPADGAVEFVLPRPPTPLAMTLPIRVTGLNRRWSAGLCQQQGYVKGDYGTGEDRYRALGLDAEGNAYVPVYANWADTTHLVAGHPVVAGPEGADLFIQVTRVADEPPRYHVSANNPADAPVTATLRVAMPMPGLDFAPRQLTLKPGEYVLIQ